MHSIWIPVFALVSGIIIGLLVGNIVPRLQIMRRRPHWQQMLVALITSLVLFEALYWPAVALLMR